ncbi:hypothetical protein TNCV_2347751 [Trichonephila clavipes]|nr:hypothetical protein TNCV_2347751 [Trichonephila clavipes]
MPSPGFEAQSLRHRLASLTTLPVGRHNCKGGKDLFLDHTGFPEGNIGLLIQRFSTNPLWSLIFNGCYLDRNPPRREDQRSRFFQTSSSKSISLAAFRCIC